MGGKGKKSPSLFKSTENPFLLSSLNLLVSYFVYTFPLSESVVFSTLANSKKSYLCHIPFLL